MNALFLQFLAGLTHAMILFLIASGLSLIFGVTRTINFAHGSFYMLAAYLTVTLGTVLPFGGAEPLRRHAACAARRGAPRRDRGDRTRAPGVSGAGAVPVAPHLRAGTDPRRRGAVLLGAGASGGPQAARTGRDGSRAGPARSHLRFCRPGARAGGGSGFVGSTASHPVGGPRPRGGLGSRDGGRPGREPGLALHRSVRRRFVVGRRSGSAPGRAPAAHHGDGYRHHRRGVRGGGDRRDGQRLRRAGGGDPPRRPPVAGDRVAPPGVPARPGLSLDGRGPHPAAVGAAGSAPGRPRLGGGAAGLFRRPPDGAARRPWWPEASCS